MKCAHYFEVGPAVVDANTLIHTLCRCKYSPLLTLLYSVPCPVGILTNPFYVFAHKSRTVTWPMPLFVFFPTIWDINREHGSTHGPLLPHWYLRYRKTRLIFHQYSHFLDGGYMNHSITSCFSCWSYAIVFTVTDKIECYWAPTPQGLPGPSAADMAKYNPQEFSLFPVKN